MRSSPVRCTALVALVALAGCSGGGPSEPSTTLGALRSQAGAGIWVYQFEDLRPEPLLAGGPILADSLSLRPDRVGTWSLVFLDVLDGTTRRRNDIRVEWDVRRDTLWVMPTCEPRELCDPLPAWYGVLAPGGRLLLLPTFRTQQTTAPRPYERVGP